MRTSQAIREQIETLKKQREELRANKRRAALADNQDTYDSYAIMLYRNAGRIEALQWALQGAGE